MVAAQQKMLEHKAFTWQLLNCQHAPNLTSTCTRHTPLNISLMGVEFDLHAVWY